MQLWEAKVFSHLNLRSTFPPGLKYHHNSVCLAWKLGTLHLVESVQVKKEEIQRNPQIIYSE